MPIYFMTRHIPKKGGAQNTEINVPIWVRVRHGRGIDIWCTTPILVNPDHWDNKTQAIKYRVNMNDEYRLGLQMKLQGLRQIITDALYKDAPKNAVTKEWLENLIKIYQKRGHQPEQRLLGIHAPEIVRLFDEFINNRDICHARQNQYRVVQHILQRYELFIQETERKGYRLNIKKIQTPDINDIADYIVNEPTYFAEYKHIFEKIPDKKAPRPRGRNTVIDILKKLSVFFNWCEEKKIIDKSPFKGFKIGQAMYGTPYYLTMEELHQVYAMDLSIDKYLEQQRDVFVFQCCVGCRVGDLYRLTREDVINGALCYVPNKTFKVTQKALVVPLNTMATTIYEKYDMVKFPRGRFLPLDKNIQGYNIAIRKILTAANITRMVSIINTQTLKEEKVPINEIASSHMARRTFCGNLYKLVKDPSLVGALSGHVEGSRAFARYREIDMEMRKETVNLLD